MAATASVATTTRLWFLRGFTTHLVNRVSLLFFGRLPGCGILTHVGRTTGRRHRNPIFVLRRGDDYVFALTYGSRCHWAQNILAAGGTDLRSRGRDIRLVEPELFVDPTRRLMPLPYRIAMTGVGVREFLSMHAA